MPQTKYDQSIIKEAVRHIQNEWDNFKICYQQLHSPNNAIYFECFLLHARNLYDFFFTPKKINDDVTITDFVPSPLKGNSYVFPKEAINKQLSHITYSRVINPINLFPEQDQIYSYIHNTLIDYNNIADERYRITE